LLQLLRAVNVKVSLTPAIPPANHERQQQASEKRQGTKSREVSTVGAAGGYGDLRAARVMVVIGRDEEFAEG
jgi:hypothetical protein